MIKVAIITGSTRPGRVNLQVAQWAQELASKRNDAEFELVDIAEFNLPLLDEPVPPSMAEPQHEHSKKWSQTISKFDAYVFVTPEYNHSTSGALKNALDYLFYEWNNKAAGIVSYGSASGVRAAEHLRLIFGELMLADVRTQVTLSLSTDFENYTVFKPAATHEKNLITLFDQVISWGTALQSVRSEK
jgi:NAD(P)H-dependent FMN reductase